MKRYEQRALDIVGTMMTKRQEEIKQQLAYLERELMKLHYENWDMSKQ